MSKQAGPVFRALVQKGPFGFDGFRHYIGKVRIQPRHHGCGRHRHHPEAAHCGRSNIRHARKRSITAVDIVPLAAAGGCREETQ